MPGAIAHANYLLETLTECFFRRINSANPATHKIHYENTGS